MQCLAYMENTFLRLKIAENLLWDSNSFVSFGNTLDILTAHSTNIGISAGAY